MSIGLKNQSTLQKFRNNIWACWQRLTSIIINAEVPPKCDPFGPDNKLIIVPCALSGASLVNTCRVSIGAKSPLTGTIKESNAGGTTGALLGKLGVTAIMIEVQVSDDELCILKLMKKHRQRITDMNDVTIAALSVEA